MARNRHNQTESIAKTFGDLRSDYDAAKTTRFRRRLTGVSSVGSGADYHYKNEREYLHMMELARSYDRNDIVVGQGITRLVDNVLQDGIKPDPQTGSDDLNKAIAERWESWSTDAEKCHNSKEHNLHSLAQMTLRSVVVDGDNVCLPLKNGSLQVIEGHRLRTPNRTKRNVVLGVRLDSSRKHIEYWITKADIDPNHSNIRVADIKPIKTRDSDGNRQVFHVYNPKRVSQTRGVTAVAPMADMIGIHNDIEFAQLVKQQASSCFAIFRQRSIEFAAKQNHDPYGEQETESLSDGSTRTLEGIGPGMDITGAPGETLTGFSPNVPNAEFFDHAKLILTFISINLNLPVAVLLLDPSETNFSGWRGAIDQARIGMRTIQRWMIAKFYQPVYDWKIRQWIETDADFRAIVEANPEADPFKKEWSPPTWQYIEPFKDAKADATIVDNHLNSRRAVLRRRGLDIEKIDSVQIEDTEKLIILANESAGRINEQFPEADVNWREIAGFESISQSQKVVEVKSGGDK
jgi:capsid protein